MLRKISLMLLSLLYLFVYWIMFYVLIDKFTFYLSTTYRFFASHKIVYDMFLISIVVSLVLAQLIVGLNLFIHFKNVKHFYKMQLLHIPLIVLAIYLTSATTTVIPFIKNWHISLLGESIAQ
ncbi:hypothetical protein BBD42_08215 [Paenibacillus sp. BIHB 4019]|uniref:Uncharacterized protein n=1 Tax=Paenibacillus sp. BIHB 4019 TaxID=1870819 RepID=A0A1B2DFH8_9BACL|nr:hypothetical protein BBD42_08215 [Paenibacillus sp. BIHB 4019]